MKKNIAVVGCGHWGKNLVRNFSELGALSAICDPNSELSNFYAEQYLVKNLSFAEILEDTSIEGVVVAVPATLHASFAIKAMKSGKHVFVEKPMALSQVDAHQMISTAKDQGVQLMVGHLLQYHPIFLAVRRLVQSNELGVLSYVCSNRLSFGKVRTEEDVIWSFAPHDISMILSLVSQEVEFVSAETANILNQGSSDNATIHMTFSSGLKAKVSVSWLHPYKEQKLVVIGDMGMVVFDDMQPWEKKLALYRYKLNLTSKSPVLDKSDVCYVNVVRSEPLKNECQHFIDVVDRNANPLSDGLEGLKVLKVLSAANLSKKENYTVKMGDV